MTAMRITYPQLAAAVVTWTIVAIALLTCSSCGPPPPDEPQQPAITGACARAFVPTLEAWEERYGRVPDDCAYLDREYPVHEVSAEDMPCEDEPGTIITGCSVLGDAIYILETRLPSQKTDTAAHEWTHLLEACVNGDIDAAHLNPELWTIYGNDTVEFDAQVKVEIGECT